MIHQGDRKAREQVYVNMVGETVKNGSERSINWVLPIEPPEPDIYKRKFLDRDYSCMPTEYSFLELAILYNTRRTVKVRQLIHRGTELEERDDLIIEKGDPVQQVINNALIERMLIKVLVTGILSPRENLFCKFLGQGIYDPRIFLFIADFFYEDESKADADFDYFETEEQESEHRRARRNATYGTALGTYIKEAREDSIDWLLPIWPAEFDFKEEWPLRSGGNSHSFESPMAYALERNKPRTLQCLLERGAQIRTYHLQSAQETDQRAASRLLLNAYLQTVMSRGIECKVDWFGVIMSARPLVDEVMSFALDKDRRKRKRKRLDNNGY